MKSSMIGMAIFLLGLSATATSAGAGEFAHPQGTTNAEATQCTPPTDARGRSCALFSRMIRASFTPREIAVIFGSATAHAEGVTGGVVLERRYRAWLREYEAARQVAEPARTIAGK